MSIPATEDLDRQDMIRLVGGHEAALNALMGRHAQPLFLYLVRMFHHEATAEDLAQETFVRVYQQRGRFRPDAKFSTWLYTIATNLGRDRLRWLARHPQVSLDAASDDDGPALGDTLTATQPTPAESLQASERAEEVRRAVAALPEDLRVPLLLAEYEDRSHAEIAEILGCTAKAVELRCYRARQALRQTLGWLLATDG